MRKIILLFTLIIFAIIFISCSTTESLPFAGKTKHKQVKYMKKKHIKQAQKGNNYYYRRNGKLLRRK